MNLEWKGLQNFSTTNKDCLTDLAKFGLTPQSVQGLAASTQLVSYAFAIGPQGGIPVTQFDLDADFSAFRNTASNATLLAYNQSNFWQINNSPMAGTLLHEIIHISGNANFALSNVQIATMLGVQNQLQFNPNGSLKDDSAISKKLAADCLPTGGRK